MPLDLVRRLITPLRHPVPGSLYPDATPLLQFATRGLPQVDPARCRGHGSCVEACPTEAIEFASGAVQSIDAGKCIFCAACVAACPNSAISMSYRVELARPSRAELIDQVLDPPAEPPAVESPAVEPASVGTAPTGGDAPASPTPAAGAAPAEPPAPVPPARSPAPVAAPVPAPAPPALPIDRLAADRARARILGRFGRSLHVRHLDAGSCNGCDWEIAALLNPYHDLQRLGIDFVASPRHADLLLVTGVMTPHLEEAALRTYEAMAEPRLVVAVGACAIGGGVFAGSPQSRDGAAPTLPVDVFVPGCPARPEAVIEGLLMAIDLRRADSATRGAST